MPPSNIRSAAQQAALARAAAAARGRGRGAPAGRGAAAAAAGPAAAATAAAPAAAGHNAISAQRKAHSTCRHLWLEIKAIGGLVASHRVHDLPSVTNPLPSRDCSFSIKDQRLAAAVVARAHFPSALWQQ